MRADGTLTRAMRAFIAAILSLGLLALPGSVPGAAASPEEVQGLKGGTQDGLKELASWIGSLESEGEFAQPIPLLETSVGEALALSDTFQAVRSSIDGLTSTDVADLAADLDSLSGNFGSPAVGVTFATSAVDGTLPVVGFDLSITASRSIAAAGIDIAAPAAGGVPAVRLRSVGDAGVPLAVEMVSLFRVRYDIDTDQFFIVEDGNGTETETDDTPRFTADAGVPTNTPGSVFTFPSTGFAAAIGFGDVTVEPSSILSVHAHYFGDINDSNLDNELAFREPGNPGELVDAELRLARSQNVEISRSGSATTTIELDSPFTTTNDAAAIEVAAPGNLDGADPVPSTSGADVAELAQFANVEPVDVVSGLVQFATLLRSLQSNPNVDFDLPLLNGKLSDVVHIEEQLAQFADDQVVDGITPDTPISEMVEFDTALELASHMQSGDEQITFLQDTNGDATGKITPAYDAATDRLTFDMHIKKTLDGAFGAFPTLPPGFEAPPGYQSDAGLPDIGDELKDTTGLRAVTDTAPSQARRKTAYEFRMPFIVDLQNSTPSEDIAATSGITEFESPMVFERFLTSTANDDDIKITAAVQTPILGRGQIGFVGVNIGGPDGLASSYTMDPLDDSTPVLVVDVDATLTSFDHDHNATTPAVPLTATPRVVDLLQNLAGTRDADGNPTSSTGDDPVVPASPSAKVDSVLKVRALGPGPQAGDDYSLTENPGTVTIAWPSISTPLAADNVTLDATAQLLEQLDITPNGDATSLLGKTLDRLTNVAGSIESGIETVGGPDGLLGKEIPLLGSSARDLFTAADTLIAEIDEFRTSPTPVTLQDMEIKFQNALGTELGLGAGARAQLLRFSLKDVIAGGPPELIVRLGFIDSDTQQVPLNLDLGFGDIVGANSNGTAALSTGSNLKLNIPVTLEAPSASDLTDADPKVLDSSGLALSVEIADQTGASKYGVNLGPLSIDLGQTPDGPQRFQFGAAFTAYPGGTEVGEGAETAQGWGEFLGSLSPNVGGGPGSPYDCHPPSAPEPEGTPVGVVTSAPQIDDAVLGCAALPIYVNTEPVTGDVDTSYLTVKVDSLTAAPEITVPPNLETAFANALFSFASMGDGLDKLKNILDLALKGATFGAKLPLIGEELQAGADVIQKIQTFVKDPLAGVGAVPGDASVEWVDENVRQPLATALTGAGLLRDADYRGTSTFAPDEAPADTTPGYTDIRLVMLCDSDRHSCARDNPLTNDGDPETTVDMEAEPITDLKEVTFEFEIGQGSRDPVDGDCAAAGDPGSLPCPADGVALPIDFALPGLNLKANQPATAKAGWNLQLGFGVNDEDGFFLLDNPRPAFGPADDGTNDAGEELKVGFGVGLEQVATGPELSGKIGFLDIEFEDAAGSHPGESRLSAGFDSNLTGTGAPACEGAGIPQANCSRRITLAELQGFNVKDGLDPVFTGNLDVGLQITTGLSSFGGDSAEITGKLPKVQADLAIGWGWTSDAPGTFESPAISLTEVGIDAGQFFSGVLRPIFEGTKRFTDPLKPVREFIFAPIPVISDVSRLFGGDDISYVDLAEIFGDVDLSLLKDVDQILSFIDTIGQMADGQNTFVPIGDGFTIDGARATGPPATPDQAKSLIQNANNEINDTLSILEDTKDEIDNDSKKQALTNLENGGSGDDDKDITIPILEEPGCVFNLLVGGDCDLFLYAPDPFEVRFDYEQAFGPFFGVLYVTVGGFAGARGRISVGYDTKGLRELIQKIDAGSATAGDAVGGLLEGVYLGDLDPDTGEDVAEFEVFAGITAGAKLSILVAEAGARGGVEATVGLNLHDGPVLDGKLRISEIRNKIAVPFCLFDVEGRLEAFLEVYLSVGVCPFCAEYDYELARVVLLDFSEGFCPNTVPTLASPGADGVIRLNVGIDAGARGGGWGNDDVGPDENFVIRQVGDAGGGMKKFSITAFGHTEERTGSSFLIRDAGAGDDTFLFQGLKTGGTPQSGTTSAAGTVDFTVPVVANLGDDNDSITTGTASDQVEGGSGNDSINVGAGNDGVKDSSTTNDVSGGPGDDTITGGSGGDVIRGGDNNDTIDGGLGEDHLYGDAGTDRILGGSDLIQVPGQSTTGDEADGGDKIVGGADGDIIDAGNGGDTIYGDEEDASLGDSTANANGTIGLSTGGQDKIAGGLGEDYIYAGADHDEVTGAGDESIIDNSTDHIWGNGGSDKIHGSLGADNIYGGPNLDQVFGEQGDDNLFGQGNSDRIEGGPGADDIDGGPQNDARSASGSFGGVSFTAGLTGGPGNDDIIGGTGSDDLFGLDGEDFLMGDLGTIDDSDPAARVASPDEATGQGDRLFGGTQDDDLFGEGGDDEMHGEAGADYMEGHDGEDDMFGQNDIDHMLGNDDNDFMEGGPEGDLMFGNDGDDQMFGQTGADRMIGGSAGDAAADTGDRMWGGTENDTMIGDNGTINSPPDVGDTGLVGTFGNDVMNGGPHDDWMYGQEGNDTMRGAGEFDRMFGNLGADTMFGEGGPDYMLGDSGTISETPGNPAIYPGGAPNRDVVLGLGADVDETPNHGGIDTMDGGPANDHMWGGAAADIMSGGYADDYMEGNNGKDSMYGASTTADDGIEQAADALDQLFDGEDDMIGGSSHANPLTATPAGADDEGETEMFGNGQEDVMTGDNAVITRHANGAGTAWLIDNITGGVRRTVRLLDTEKRGDALVPVSGPDTMYGNDANDRMYGEADTDCLKGNDHEDYVEGNQDRDFLEGNDAQDDIVGGTSFVPDASDALVPAEGQPDDGDYIHGGGEADVATGDNAVITRDDTVPGPPYNYVTDLIEIPTARSVRLLDLTNPDFADAAGPDQVAGGAGTDVLFGQDEGDFMSGGSENDYMEGNGDTDYEWGDLLFADVNAAPPAELPGGIPAVIPALAACASAEPQLSGVQGEHGQDDQIGGSSIKAHRDDGDFIYGNGAQDFQLGDNGELLRKFTDASKTVYLTFEDANPNTYVRRAVRFDVGGPAMANGPDYMEGNAGDDYMWGQDDNDIQFGGTENDDMFGELHDDRMFGEAGEDAMLGDRGVIVDDLIEVGDPDDPAQYTVETKSPPFVTYTAFRPGTLDRRFDLLADGDGDVDGDGNPVESPGLTSGGQDFMRGGPDHDTMHGAFGDDVMNGDSDGDILFGDDGADAIWGGKGSTDANNLSDRGENDEFLDYIWGGHGGDPNLNQGAITGGADVIDYRPRPGSNPDDPSEGSPDPAVWFEITDTDDPDSSDNQHHQGVDWIYGGWDRDVMQANVAGTGPNDGDRLLDWDGAYNLYTHCEPDYGGYNDLRALSPIMIDFIQRWSYGSGVGSSLDDVKASESSAFREVALVYPKDNKNNSGKAYPTTPGHFEDFSCAP